MPFCFRFPRRLGAYCLITMAAAWAPAMDVAMAGGGPENVFVVVNKRSWSSMTIANHFCSLRRIPASNVFFHEWKGGSTWTTVEGFREVILNPILKQIDMRRLGGQIDYIVYSSDFPYEIRFNADLAQPQLYASGSITGLTYLAQLVQSKDPRNYARSNNRYMRMPQPDERGIPRIEGTVTSPTRGFRAGYQWGPAGERVETEGLQYILSVMLAHTSGRGNSVREAIHYLRRSALADGTHPQGTFYFMVAPNSDPRYQTQYDIRSTYREKAFPAAVRELHELGVGAQVVKGQVLPEQKSDVLGVMTGTRLYDWRSSGSTLVPGAICENLTSFAGVLHGEGETTQTRLSEFLRYGAAGSCGTVVEPSLTWPKFPNPMVFAHYVRGCSLAEAFYQSILSPYQQLIVGDPLCRPWAQIPIVTVDGVSAADTVSGVIELTPAATTPSDSGIAEFELYVDGQRVAQGRPGGSFSVDTRNLGDGYHEFRIVAVDSSLIETQGRLILPLIVNNHDRKLAWQVHGGGVVPWERPVVISVASPGAKEIVIVQGRRIVGGVKGSQGQVRIDPKDLGCGPVLLQAVGLSDTESNQNPNQKVLGSPIRLRIRTPQPLPAERGRFGAAPVQLILRGGQRVPVTVGTDKDWLINAGVKLDEPFEITGPIEAPEEDVYQFELEYQGEMEVRVNGRPLFDHTGKTNQHYYVPVALKSGTHRVSIRGTLRTTPKFFLAFGNRGTSSISSPPYGPRSLGGR